VFAVGLSFVVLRTATPSLLNRVEFLLVGWCLFFNMLLVVENANTDLPPIGFCIEPLIGSKYVGVLLLGCCW
jgi:hypothetical protein